MIIESELADLWLEMITRRIQGKLAPGARIGLKKRVQSRLSKLLGQGAGLHLRRTRSGKLIASVLIGRDRLPWETKANWRFTILSFPGDRASLNWARSILEDRLALLVGGRCKGELELWQMGLLPWLEKQGIHPRSVILDGNVSDSIARLRRHYGEKLREPFESAGLNLEPARTRSEVDAYLRILRREYRRNPQFGEFVGNPSFQKMMRKDLLHRIRKGRKPLWLVRRGGKLLGGADLLEIPQGTDGRRTGGLGLNLTREAQGRDFARAIYERMLLELQSRGIERYFGYTGQTGVMRLGKIMGRKLNRVEVDRGIAPHFPKGHFKLWF